MEEPFVVIPGEVWEDRLGLLWKVQSVSVDSVAVTGPFHGYVVVPIDDFEAGWQKSTKEVHA